MKRRFKLLAAATGAVALTALLALLALPAIVDSELARARARALIETRTGLDVRVGGGVQLQWLPVPRVIVTDVRIANPPGFPDRDRARIGSLSLAPELVSLLRGGLRAKRLEVTDVDVYLERNAAGIANWGAAPRAHEDGGATRHRRETAPASKVVLDGFDLSDARLVWRDANDARALVSFGARTGAIDPARDIDDVRIRAWLPARTDAPTSILEARGHVSLAKGGAAFHVPNLAVAIEDAGAMARPLTIAGRLSVDTTNGRLLIENLRADVRSSDADVTLGATLRGSLDSNRYVLENLHAQGRVGRARHLVELEANVDVRVDARTLTADVLRAAVAETEAHGQLELRVDSALSRVSGTFDLDVASRPLTGDLEADWAGPSVDVALNLAVRLGDEPGPYGLRGRNEIAVRARIDERPSADRRRRLDGMKVIADLADPSAPNGRLRLTLETALEIDVAREHVVADNLRLEVHDSRISGTLSVRGFEKPAVRFDLEADAIDADRMLPAIIAGGAEKGEATPVHATVEALRAMDVEGEMRVGRLAVRGVRLENVRLVAGGAPKGG